MMEPDAFRFRGNTNNTSYGFDQVVDKQEDEFSYVNHQYGNIINQPNNYKFKAAGNRGSLKHPPTNEDGRYGFKVNRI